MNRKIKEETIMAVTVLTADNFQKEVLESNKTVLVDFWASWCGPCRMLSPLVDEIGETVSTVKVGKVNVDEEMELAQRYGISSIPCLKVFKGGQVVKSSVGAVPKPMVEALLD
jgi:thioredoxin 1